MKTAALTSDVRKLRRTIVSAVIALATLAAACWTAFAQPVAPGLDVLPAPLSGYSLPGHGPEPAPEEGLTAGEYLARADELFASGDFVNAFGQYMKGLELADKDELRAKARLGAALVYVELGEDEKAFAEFVEALRLYPDLKLEPASVSPEAYAMFTEAAKSVHEGVLVCKCEPLGASVYLDGEYIGETPVRREGIPQGEYELTLKKPGFEPSTSRVNIKTDVTLTVEDKLVPAGGEITVTSEPPGASVKLDGREEGTTPLVIGRVSAGVHDISLSRPYFEPRDLTVELERDEKKNVGIVLPRRLLFVGLEEGRDDSEGLGPQMENLAAVQVFEARGIEAIPAGLKSLGEEMEARGLKPQSLEFMRLHKRRLELQDLAVLAGIMERFRVELALVMTLDAADEVNRLNLTLYSTSSDLADSEVITAGSLDGLKEGFAVYLDRWARQERSEGASIGARMADAEGGGARITSILPGFPAGRTGLMPDDVITEADGVPVSDAAGFFGTLEAGRELHLTFHRRGRPQETKITPVAASLETPVDSEEYLYNLALVSNSGVLETVEPGGGRGDIISLAALNLGNVYYHLGYFDKAAENYASVKTSLDAGVCTGTALFRLGSAYEKLERWTDAAGAYRKAMMLYPFATLGSAQGPYAAPLARERLRKLFELKLVRERWWL